MIKIISKQMHLCTCVIKNIGVLILLLLCVSILDGCGQENKGKAEIDGYNIYYKDIVDSSLVKVKKSIDDKDLSDAISSMLQAMMNPESTDKYKSTINKNVKILDYAISENIVYINFSSEYSKQDTIEELLCRAALVLTISQLDGVDFVGLNVDGQQLSFKNNTVSLLKASDFTDVSVDSVLDVSKMEVTMYYGNKNGDKLVAQTVTVSCEPKCTIEESIMSALIKGPDSDKFLGTLPENTIVKNAYTRNGVCYVYFDKSFAENIFNVKDDIMIYSIVNTLSELTYVNKVKLVIDNGNIKKINEKIDISEPFIRNLDLIEKEN